MAQGDVHIDGDGKITLDATGKVRLVDVGSDCPDCCDGCTASGTSCTHCDDTTPSQYTVTFSGVSMCDTCVSYTDEDARFDFSAGDVLNTSHTLTQATACRWEKAFSGIAIFIGASCVSGPFGLTTTIRLERSASDWTLNVFTDYTGETQGFIFYDVRAADTSGADQLCSTLPSFSGDAASCAGAVGGDEAIGTGGTATVVCV